MKPILPLVTLLALGACGPSADVRARVASVGRGTGNSEAGHITYDRECASCHGADAKSGGVKKNLPHAAKDERDEALERIVGGGGGMPSFARLSDQQIADVLAYLQTL